MTTAQAVVSVLEGWLAEGVHEEPAHSNRTKIGQEFGWNGVAWCAEGCSVAHKHVQSAADWSASVAQWIADARAGKNGMQWIARDAEVRVGDHPCFDWEWGTAQAGNPSNFHISTIVNPGTQEKFETIGCNENDAVTLQWRDRTWVQGYVRPAYDVVPTPVPQPPALEKEQLMQIWYTPNEQGGDHGVAYYLTDGVKATHIESEDTLKNLLTAGVVKVAVSAKDISSRR